MILEVFSNRNDAMILTFALVCADATLLQAARILLNWLVQLIHLSDCSDIREQVTQQRATEAEAELGVINLPPAPTYAAAARCSVLPGRCPARCWCYFGGHLHLPPIL